MSLIILLILGSVTVVLITSRSHQIQKELILRDKITSEKNTPNLITDIGNYYNFNFDIFAQESKNLFSQYPDIVHFRIISPTADIQFDSSELQNGKYDGATRSITDSYILKIINSKKTTQDFSVVNNKKVIRVFAPYVDNYDSYRGVGEYDYSMEEITRSVHQTIIDLVLLFGLFQILGVGITYLLISRITKPILTLAEGARAIGKGQLDYVVSNKSKDEIGELAVAFNGMIHDIKASKEVIENQNAALKHDEARLKASIESLNIGFIMTDVNNNTLMVNRTASDILSYTIGDDGQAKTVKSSSRKGHLSIEDIDSKLSPAVGLKKKLETVNKYGMPLETKEIDYRGRILHIFLAPIMEFMQGNLPIQLGTVILIEDITEEKVLDRSRDEFFSIASHELRTPLTAIRGNTSLIQQYFSDQLKDEALRGMINDIHESSTRLIDIVNDFLDLSRLEQGKVTLKKEEFSLEPIIENIVYEMRVVLQEKKLYLKFDKMTLDSLPKVFADKDRVKQVVYNLVGNAAKFTEKGGITIAAELQGEKIKINVTDTGRGIPLESQKLLFHKFQQASNSLLTRDTTRGTGLGLYISKMLVEKMGGKVSLEHSVEGQGSTFSFTLPVSTPEIKQKTANSQPTAETDIKTGLTKAD